jgi:Zn-dependent M28 family amino/carboxypeptidase
MDARVGALRTAAVVATVVGTAGSLLLSRGRQLAPLTAEEQRTALALRRHVEAIASEPHNIRHPSALRRAEDYITATFRAAGYTPARRPYRVALSEVANVEAERRGRTHPERIVVVGAHYDSVADVPGADDNGSGVAVLLELARRHAAAPAAAVTVRFVAFVNEEPPYFMTSDMGSLVYAREAAAAGEDIAAMISLETLGYYREEKGTQHYPAPFHLLFRDRGNFVAMVSNVGSAAVLRRAASAFRRATTLPVIAVPAPERIPGIGWSDHWSFWQSGFRAIMLTDTAPYRNPHYHSADDTPDTLDYERLARVVTGCTEIVRSLSGWRE